MIDMSTTISIIILTTLCAITSVNAIRHLLSKNASRPLSKTQKYAAQIFMGISTLTLIYRWAIVHNYQFNTLDSKVDSLLFVCTLLAAVIFYLRLPKRLPGIDAFGFPIITVLLLWSLCSNTFTSYTSTDNGPSNLIRTTHLLGVYSGTLFFALSAIMACFYLYIQHKLKDKAAISNISKLPSLERVENMISSASTLGFALLTVGLITGFIWVNDNPGSFGDAWWLSPKTILAFIAWGAYAIVMNVKYATTFRGDKAAYLSILGFILIIMILGLAFSDARAKNNPPSQSNHAPEIQSTQEVAL